LGLPEVILVIAGITSSITMALLSARFWPEGIEKSAMVLAFSSQVSVMEPAARARDGFEFRSGLISPAPTVYVPVSWDEG